jgi:hypothetical protein
VCPWRLSNNMKCLRPEPIPCNLWCVVHAIYNGCGAGTPWDSTLLGLSYPRCQYRLQYRNPTRSTTCICTHSNGHAWAFAKKKPNRHALSRLRGQRYSRLWKLTGFVQHHINTYRHPGGWGVLLLIAWLSAMQSPCVFSPQSIQLCGVQFTYTLPDNQPAEHSL